MGKGLTKTELTGIILLGILITVITGSAVLMKNCTGLQQQPALPPRIEVIDSSSNNKEYTPSGRQPVKKSKKKSGARKKGATGSSSKSNSSPKAGVERPDPFLDTIPTEWDDPLDRYPG